jgi:adenosylcobyric acid synthase
MDARPPRARAFMVLGTSSHAGKSAVAAGLCRLLARRGLRVAPFKAQNMSNNSHVTPEGAEIGRAQAMQARAAGVESHADMNPVLLKPSGQSRSQVVLHGRPIGHFTAGEYYSRKVRLGAEARLAYDRLAARHEVIVLEGAGSPAEINLREEDFVNGAMAEHAGARCLLVADIERGGVFASILGTLRLMEPRHRDLVAGVVINRFRGDPSLLEPGLREIERLTGVPVLGVIPWLEGLDLDEEDSLALPAAEVPPSPGAARPDIAVLRFPRISNFTDFKPLERTEGLRLRYVDRAADLGNPDLLILPGSKDVRADLAWLGNRGLDRVVIAAAARRIPVLGICGGYQMLGRRIADPFGTEGPAGEAAGLGLLPAETVMAAEKETVRVEARNLGLPFLETGRPLAGYEIHVGRTRTDGAPPALELTSRMGVACREPSGAAAEGLPVTGVYLHGLFDAPGVAEELRDWLLRRRGLEPSGGDPGGQGEPADGTGEGLPAGRQALDEALDRIAGALERHVRLDLLLSALPDSPHRPGAAIPPRNEGCPK